MGDRPGMVTGAGSNAHWRDGGGHRPSILRGGAGLILLVVLALQNGQDFGSLLALRGSVWIPGRGVYSAITYR